MRNWVICGGIRSRRGYQHQYRRCVAGPTGGAGEHAARPQCSLACRVQRRLARGCAGARWSQLRRRRRTSSWWGKSRRD